MVSVSLDELTKNHAPLLGDIFSIATQPYEMFEKVGRETAEGLLQIAPNSQIKPIVDALDFGTIALMTIDKKHVINLGGFGLALKNAPDSDGGGRYSPGKMSSEELLGYFFMSGIMNAMLEARPNDPSHDEIKAEMEEFAAKYAAHLEAIKPAGNTEE